MPKLLIVIVVAFTCFLSMEHKPQPNIEQDAKYSSIGRGPFGFDNSRPALWNAASVAATLRLCDDTTVAQMFAGPDAGVGGQLGLPGEPDLAGPNSFQAKRSHCSISFKIPGEFLTSPRVFQPRDNEEKKTMDFGRGALLWLLGVPLPIIILLALFWHH